MLPQKVDLTYDQVQALKFSINESNLNNEDKTLIKGLIDFNGWLQQQLLEKKISINRLKTIIFGEPQSKSKLKTRKYNPNNAKTKSNADPSHEENSGIHADQDIESNKTNNGRLIHQRYLNNERVTIKHSQFQAGDLCPTACGGRLWNATPGTVIKISGQGFAKATHYQIEKLRCNLCGHYVSASLPASVSEDKYDYAFKAQLCLMKYFMGMPLYRIEAYQKLLGIPLPDSTQWDLIEQVANDIYPIFYTLEYLAAQGRLVHADDTNVKILDNISANKHTKNPKTRKGTFTTGIISYYQDHIIHLNYSSTKHAGENMTRLLNLRHKQLSPINYMCDALSRNVPKEHDVILMNCIAHARRKFVEIEPFFPEECSHVIEQLGIIYRHDAYTKDSKMYDVERLTYHQTHSGPVMSRLKTWLKKQLEDNLVEENNSLGKAIQYMLKHWGPLTQFLKIEWAPLDNNISEASLKVPIRIRKSAMFYKTEHGAFIGSMMVSIIQACQANEVNPVDFLTTLQANKSQIFKEPSKWLPWTYANQISPQAVACTKA